MNHHLPDLTVPYPISSHQVAEFQQHGFLFLSQVLSAEELDAYRRVIDAVVQVRTKHDTRTLAEKTPYEQALTQCGHLWSEFQEVEKLTCSPRLGGIARDLLRAEQVRLWHDQALYKQPGGRGTDPHIDMAYWPMLDRVAGTIWIALESVTLTMGAMQFVPGSHRINWDINDFTIREDTNLMDAIPAAFRQKPVGFDLNPGDATFHHGMTVHYTGPNHSDRIRKGMTVIYYPDGVRFNAHSPMGDHHCAAGTPHGEPIRTPKNPVIA
ncbi:MAG: phytanoyl-CoA dioxygenase family protein [Lentisphaeria bacterium]|nr:phytanoyl-CoA dioxygenase family protein [Candidatus Neomarinimicrobiota bacterium]MCF7841614.1 phytanoyl-CoA dioxygenase family protein [Lentisphaeria bacterium]